MGIGTVGVMAHLGNVVTRLRRAVARRPTLFWLLVVVVASTGALAAAQAVGALEAERERWGKPVDVFVTERPVDTGTRLADVTRVRSIPLALAPDFPVAELQPGAVAMHPLGAGEILSAVDVSGTAGARELAPSSSQIVAMIEAVPSGARIGQRGAVAADGVVLTTDAVVVGTFGEATLLAVRNDDAPAVAAAAVESRATLLVDS